MDTARPRRLATSQPQSCSRRSTTAISRSEWVRAMLSRLSPTRRPSSSSAAPPASVAVSSASSLMRGSLARRAGPGSPAAATFELTTPRGVPILESLMAPPPRQTDSQMDAEVREKIHLEILKRTGAYHANDHVLLPSGHHTSEYIEKTLVTTEASFTEGLGAVIAKHFAQWPIDVVLSTGPGALILSHCVARAHPSRPTLAYGTKGVSAGKRRVTLPVEFQRFIRPGTKVLIVEDLVSSGTTVRLLSQLVEELGGQVVGIGALWRRTKKSEIGGKEIFSLVSRDFPTYAPETCPLCKKGVPLNQEYVKRREHRKPSSAHEKS